MFQVFTKSNAIKGACDQPKARFGQLSKTQIVLVLILAVIVFAGLLPNSTHAQEQRQFSVKLRTMHIDDEDDDLTNDEPYLLMYQFKMRFDLSDDGRTATVDRRSLVVGSFFRNYQNNLGFGSDNWADEEHSYTFPERADLFLADSVNVNESWIFGAVIVLMEEDAFGSDTVRLLSTAIKDELQAKLSGMTPAVGAPDRVANLLLRDTLAKISAGNIGGVIGRLLKITQPDDFGGIQVVIATVTPIAIKGRLTDLVLVYSGDLPTSIDPTALLRGITPVTDRALVRLRFPAGDLGRVPGIARYNGALRINGVFRTLTYRL